MAPTLLFSSNKAPFPSSVEIHYFTKAPAGFCILLAGNFASSFVRNPCGETARRGGRSNKPISTRHDQYRITLNRDGTVNCSTFPKIKSTKTMLKTYSKQYYSHITNHNINRYKCENLFVRFHSSTDERIPTKVGVLWL